MSMSKENSCTEVQMTDAKMNLLRMMRAENHPKIKLTFIKKDGTEREMTCIPYNDIPPPAPSDSPINRAPSTKRSVNDSHRSIVAVWEENVGWRSVDADRVTKIEVLL